MCSALARADEATDLEEVVVTGSHIRGADAAGSKPIVLDRKQSGDWVIVIADPQ